MARPLISFIIPIYNGEEYIDNCLKSIMDNNQLSYEIILVNDGSSDKTAEICVDYAKNSSAITDIHTDNFGQGKARNIGLQVAKGKYVMFVDIDDTIILAGVLNMINIAEEQSCDIVCASYYRLEHQGKIYIDNKITDGSVDKLSEEAKNRYKTILDKSVFGYLWTKIYRLDFINKTEIKFDEERKVFMEDSMFNHKMLTHKPIFFYTNTPCYTVNVTNQSTTRQIDEGIVPNSIKSVNSFYNYLISNNKYDDNLDLIIPLSMRIFSYALIKNFAYQKLSFKTIHGNVKPFIKADVYNKIAHTKKAQKYLWKLNSYAERVLYTFCLFSLKNKLSGVISLAFFVAHPLFKIYLNKNVK